MATVPGLTGAGGSIDGLQGVQLVQDIPGHLVSVDEQHPLAEFQEAGLSVSSYTTPGPVNAVDADLHLGWVLLASDDLQHLAVAEPWRPAIADRVDDEVASVNPAASLVLELQLLGHSVSFSAS